MLNLVLQFKYINYYNIFTQVKETKYFIEISDNLENKNNYITNNGTPFATPKSRNCWDVLRIKGTLIGLIF